jgi:FAD/FMN-containing dehydrogenase/Fe-S oxidoreductase
VTGLSHRQIQDLQAALRARVGHEAQLDAYTRALYSTDASNHLLQPLGVFFPRNTDELAQVMDISAEWGIPVLPRGSGTSLGGQAVGAALVLDCSRHLRAVTSIDPEARTAVVEPGVVCQVLNGILGRHGLMLGPDPASADRATVGGMIGNNASGAHSIRYGMTADHVVECDVILSDGSQMRLGPVSLQQARQRSQAAGREGSVYATALRASQEYAAPVRARWPKTWRRSSGYSLNYLVGHVPSAPPAWYDSPRPYPPSYEFNLAPLICGSEGTLALVASAKVRLVERPKATVLVLLSYASIAEACEDTPALLESEPAAIELIPRTLLRQARLVPAYARRLGFLPEDPAALLVVEFAGESLDQVRAQAAGIPRPGLVLDSPEAQADLWTVRKVGLGLLMSVPGPAKPVTFIEDVAVPVDRLVDYVRAVDRLLTAHGTRGEWYAHASAGCLHMRPLIDLKSAGGVAQMRAIADQVADLAVEMGGSISGEHGDGLSHTEFNPRLFGPELMRAFQEIKTAFDPHALLNPGKVVPLAAAPAAVDRDLRYGGAYRTHPIETTFRFHREGGLAGAVEACNGAGVCRKEGGVMCPSFQATREEAHSTRGRANALRAALSGILPPGALTSREMHGILDLCLECKGCKAECPTSVDMARVKSEFLAQYQAVHGVPVRSRFFAEVAAISSAARGLAPLVNWAGKRSSTRQALAAVLGLAPERSLPALATRSFRDGWRRRPQPVDGDPVVLFVDTFTEYQHPEVGQAAVEVLEAGGWKVELVPRHVCCGRPMISKGLLHRARASAQAVMEALDPWAARGVPIVGLEPSCLLTLRDEYLDLFPDDARAQRVGRGALLLEEFLTQDDGTGQPRGKRIRLDPQPMPVRLHGHCHAKSLVGSQPMLEMLRLAYPDTTEIDSGCCGMAGSFGYEAEHYDLSMAIGRQRLFPAVSEGQSAGARIAAAGASCRAQIQDGAGVEARHPVQLLAEALRPVP